MTYMTSQAEKHYNEIDEIERFDEMLLDKIEDGSYEISDDLVNNIIADASTESLRELLNALIIGKAANLSAFKSEVINLVLNEMKEEINK